MNWQKVFFLVAMLLLLAGFGYLFFHKIGEVVELKRKQLRYQAEIETQEARLSYLVKETDALERDPEATVNLAREKLGLTKKNERIFIFEPTPLPSSSPEQ
jgi:cell division protein FtsB